MTEFSTLHIFGFGDVQVILPDGSGATKKASDLTMVQPVVDNVWDNRPEGYTGTKQYHAINIFDNMFADWQAKVDGEKGYRVQYVDLNNLEIMALVDEVLEPVPPPSGSL